MSAVNFTVLTPPTITSFTPASGAVGSTVTITSTNFTGTTSVKFNGIAATTFTVVSATSITATVSAGATTGTINVTTPGGLAQSSTNFTILVLTSIVVTPATASVAVGATQQFTASAKDQFGAALSTQPTFTWTVDTGGSGNISSSGLYTAGSTPGSATVRAASGSVSGTAGVTVSASSILTTLTVTPGALIAGMNGTGTVVLNSAPAANTDIALSSSDPSVAAPSVAAPSVAAPSVAAPSVAAPSVVTVLAGQTSATFNVSSYTVPTHTTVTVTAYYGGVNKTASVTVDPSIDLTSAATGSTRITLYWKGIPSANAYNVYRSTTSGGPYIKLNPSPVAVLDTGPGLTNSYIYADTGVSTGVEYYYVVRGVASALEVQQSNEDGATPSANAIPWDSASPAQIISTLTTSIEAATTPNFDQDTGDLYPATAGLLTVIGPNGITYQGNYPDGSAAAAYPQTTNLDRYSGIVQFGDGTAASMSSDSSDISANPSANGTLVSPPIGITDQYEYPGNYTGIWRKVETQGLGFTTVGVCGLPNPTDPNSVILATHTYPAGAMDSDGNPKTGPYSDSADIYMGGHVSYDGTAKGKKYDSYELDAGLMTTTNLGGLWTPGWIPFIKPGKMAMRSVFADATTLPIIGGGQSGWKIDVRNETLMQFLTPVQNSVPDCIVVLNLNTTINSIANPSINYYHIHRDPVSKVLSLSPPVACNSASIAYYAGGWRKSATNDSTGNNVFTLKRMNSIAQTLRNLDKGTNKIYPVANAPTEVAVQNRRFITDSSAVRGAYWGVNGDPLGVQAGVYNTYFGTWTDDLLVSSASGAYPNSKLSGYGYVTWVNHNGFYWETNINLKTNHSLP